MSFVFHAVIPRAAHKSSPYLTGGTSTQKCPRALDGHARAIAIACVMRRQICGAANVMFTSQSRWLWWNARQSRAVAHITRQQREHRTTKYLIMVNSVGSGSGPRAIYTRRTPNALSSSRCRREAERPRAGSWIGINAATRSRRNAARSRCVRVVVECARAHAGEFVAATTHRQRT